MKSKSRSPLLIGLLVVMVLTVLSVALAEHYYTVIIRSNLRVGDYIADTTAFALDGNGAAVYRQAVYVDGGLQTDIYLVSWRFVSDAQEFVQDNVTVGDVDSTAYLGYYPKSDSLILYRSDTTYNKTAHVAWFRLRQAP